MRVLVVSNLYPPHYVGGYELRCELVVNALRARGHQVSVLTSNHVVPSATGATEESHVSRTLRIHGFFGHPWLGIGALRELEFHNNNALRQAVQKTRPDLIHVWNLGGLSKSLCHTLPDFQLPFIYDVSDHWIARSLAADVWLNWWNRENPSPKARVLRTWWTLTGTRKRWSDVAPTDPVSAIRFPNLYFCSRALQDLTLSKGYPVEHGKVIYCVVDTEKFHGTPVPASRPLRKLLYVGRLAEDKGVMTALQAMLAVKGRFAGELHVFGKGDADYTLQLKSFVSDRNLPVQFHSATPAEMPAVYRAHDALLFTSEWEEPFALTPLEAMASGLPVIGTMSGGSRELFRHGENGLTYDAGNAQQLAQRILEMDANPAHRARMAATGNEEVRAKFSEPIIIDQIEKFLLQVARQVNSREAVAV